MEILRYSMGQLQTNCYFLIDKSQNCLIIDPGDEGSFLLEQIEIKKIKPLAILVTHGHFDHLMAVGEIQKSFNIPFYINFKDQFLLRTIKQSAKYFLEIEPTVLPVKNLIDLNKKNNIKIKDFNLKILKTPGHTPGSVCFYLKEEKILFSGDTLFKEGIGRYDFSYSNKKDLFNSLKKIFQLPKEIKFYPGHGLSSTLGEEESFIKTII